MKVFSFIAAIAFLTALTAGSSEAQQQIRLEALTDQKTFSVEILWTPADIGEDNTFSIRFIEPETGSEMEEIKYNLLVYQGEDRVPETRRMEETSTQQQLVFQAPGSYTIKIDDIEGLGESATFPIEVTPEFPPWVLGIAAAATGAVLFTRRICKNLFSL